MTDWGVKLIIALISYLLGSIPFSYIIAKKFAKIDISREGSQNIGARNALEVTKNKWIGLTSLILDFSKGLIAVFIGLLFNKIIDYGLIGAIFAVLGHNYSIFMNFKGGRGLATSAGAMIFIAPLSIFVWIAIYFIANVFSSNIHIRSVIATIGTFAAMIVNFSFFFWGWQYEVYFLSNNSKYFMLLLGLIIISKHIKPIQSFFKNEII